MNYSPSQEPNGERVFYLTIERSQCVDNSARIIAQVIRRSVPSGINPDTNLHEHNDGATASGFRNCSWSSNSKNAVFVEGLEINSFISLTDDETPRLSNIYFRDVYSIELADARAMVRTLESIDKQMTKLDNQFGYANGIFSAYLIRVASILKINTFIVNRFPYSTTNLSNMKVKEYKPKEVEWLVKTMIEEAKGKK